jgi:glutaconyl-CoA decarboxylase
MKRYKIQVNGRSYDVEVEELGGSLAGGPVPNSAAAAAPGSASVGRAPAASAATFAGAASAATGAVTIKAPMPGTLMAYRVSVGQAVRKGDVVLILEAMKMENEIVAPSDGSITALRAAEGSSVNTGDPLLELG